MAFTYTTGYQEVYMDGGSGHWARWWRKFTVTEQTPTSANYIRLKIEVQTQTNPSYTTDSLAIVYYTHDKITYNGQNIYINPSNTSTDLARAIPGTASYYGNSGVVVSVPVSWNNKTLRFSIANYNVDVKLVATAATPSVVNASDGTFGQSIPITLSNVVSGVKHTMTVSCGGISTTLLTNSSATTATWTPDVATYAAVITSASSAQATITCTTYYNDVSMGSNTKTITMSFDASDVAPITTTGWAIAAPLNEFTNAINGNAFTVWIQGYSKARISFDSSKITLKYNATITKYTVSFNGTDTDVTPPTTTGDTGVIPGISANIVCSVTDSRGFTVSETITVSLIGYTLPVISDPSVFRCDIDGDPDEDEYYIAAKATASISQFINASDVDENAYSMKAFVRELDQQYSGNGTTMTSGVKSVLSLYSPDVSYEVKIELSDGLGNTATYLKTLPTRAWAMKFRETGDGVAFGKAPGTGSANAKLLEIGPGWALRIWSSDGTTYEDLDYTALHGLLQ